ncbi:MAG: DUF4190 domain-containing protein [Actinobacteria bacterium]|nr:DUF4190 domain-containing protein [Actinomycetota bacterium]
MRCDSCGMEIPDHALFCPKCGAQTALEGPGATSPGVPSPPPPHYVPGAGKKTSGLSVASLIMGIGGFICFPVIMPILAIIFGILSKREIKRSGGRTEGSGMANAGLALGIVALAIPVILAAVLIPLGITNISETRVITRSVPTSGASSVETNLVMHTGKLQVSGGADSNNMVQGTFTYNVPRWKPDIDRDFSGSTGRVTIQQPSHWWSGGLMRAKNKWQIKLNDTVPVKLDARLESVESVFDLEKLQLESFKANTTSGNLSADLSGDHKLLKLLNTTVTSGNTALDLTGSYSESLEASVKATSGNIDINLAGFWTGNLDMDIEATSGNITIKLPDDIGVYITASATSGEINAPELDVREEEEDRILVNDAYKKTDTTLFINIEATSGNINLRVNGK